MKQSLLNDMRLILSLCLLISFIGCRSVDVSAASVMDSNKYVVKEYIGPIKLKIKKIDYRSDLVRIYCSVSGAPHTAFRFDDMSIQVDSNSSPKLWLDVDGVDAKRWFQFEDSGVIDLEIDFPAFKPFSTATIIATSPKGVCRWHIQSVKNKNVVKRRK